MHILCVYQHYANFDCANSGRVFTFLQHLTKRHKVSLISGDHWESQRVTNIYPWVPENVEWIPVPVPYSNSMSSLQRLQAYTRFPIGAIMAGRKTSPDVVYGISTPLTTGWAARKLARHHGVPWVFEIRDLWPEFPVQMGAVRNRFVRRQLYGLEESLYRDADHIVTVSPDMTDHVRAHDIDSSRITTLLQGTNIDLADEAIRSPTPDEFSFGGRKVILYAGTFGRANAILSVLKAARALSDRTDIVFVFTGDGFHRADIEQAASEYDNVVLIPPVPRHHIMKLFRSATLSLVPFSNLPVLATNSPAKFFDSLAVGTPVLVTNPGWTKKFIEDHRCGYYAPVDATDLIVDSILTAANSSDKNSIMAQNSMNIARELFDRDHLAQQLENIFLDVTGV